MPASFSGRNTLPNTVAHGISVGSWNTKPMPAARRPRRRATQRCRASARSGRRRCEAPSTCRSPTARAATGTRPRARRDRARRAPACRCRKSCRRRAAKRSARPAAGGHRYLRIPISVIERRPALDLGFMVGGELLDALPGIGSKPIARNFVWISGCLTTSTIAAPSFGANVFRHSRRAVDAEPAGQHHARARRPARMSARPATDGWRYGLLTREALDRAGADLLAHHRRHLDDAARSARAIRSFSASGPPR